VQAQVNVMRQRRGAFLAERAIYGASMSARSNPSEPSTGSVTVDVEAGPASGPRSWQIRRH